jgi:hypothetical protein
MSVGLHELRDEGFELLRQKDGDDVYVHREKKLVAVDLSDCPAHPKGRWCAKCWPRVMEAIGIADEAMAPPSKFGKEGEWNLRDVCKEAATIIESYMKENFDPDDERRRIVARVRDCRLWDLDSSEAWAAWDALASQANLDPAFRPLARWLKLLSELRGASE